MQLLSYLPAVSSLLPFLHPIPCHQPCISSSTPRNWNVVKWFNTSTMQINIVRVRENRNSSNSKQVHKEILLEGYKFFLFFLFLMTWPPSVLIFFFWSSFPDSLTKRFLLRSLLMTQRHWFIARNGKFEVQGLRKRRERFRMQSIFHHFIMFLCWLSRSPSSPMRSRTAEEACCSKAVPSPLRLNLTSHRTRATG